MPYYYDLGLESVAGGFLDWVQAFLGPYVEPGG